MEYQGDVTINGIARALYHSWVKSESAESHAPYLFEDTEKMNSLSHLQVMGESMDEPLSLVLGHLG